MRYRKRRNHRLGLAALLLFVSSVGCGSGGRPPLVPRAGIKPERLTPVHRDMLAGTWVTKPPCSDFQASNLEVAFELPKEGELAVRISGSRIASRQIPPGTYRGSLDGSNGYFQVRLGRGPNSIGLHGIVLGDEEVIVAVPEPVRRPGQPYGPCGALTIVRPDRMRRIDEQRLTPERNVRLNPTDCPREIRTWLEEYVAWQSALPPAVVPRDARAVPTTSPSALFRDTRFEPLFGRPYEKMSSRDRATLLGFVKNPRLCRLEGVLSREKSLRLARTLQDRAVAGVVRDGMAIDALKLWLARLSRTLGRRELEDTAAEASALRGIARTVFVLEAFMGPGLSRDEAREYARALLDRQERVAASQARECAGGRWQTIDDVERGASCWRDALELVRGVEAARRDAALRPLEDKFRKDGVNLLRSWLSTLRGRAGMDALRRGEALASTVPRPTGALMGPLVDQARMRLVTESVRALRAEYARKVGSAGGLSQLAAAVRFTTRLQVSDALGRSAEFRDLVSSWADERRRLLRSNQEQLDRVVESAQTKVELEEVERRYLHPDDESQVAASAFRTSLKRRTKLVAPFEGLATAPYFQAIYEGDFEEAMAIERRFGQSQVAWMGQGLQAWGTLADLFTGGRARIADKLKYLIANFPIINMIMQVYLTEYPQTFSTCVESDAVRFEKPIVEQWVTRNGFGAILHRGPQTIRYRNFVVNRRFLPVWNEIGPSSEGADFSHALMGLFRGPGRESTIDYVMGVREIMSRFDCRDPRLLRLEDNMMRYYFMKKTVLERGAPR